jgi:hypothetical protein
MVIVSRRSGRMGNRIFTFAHFMANSIEYGPYQVLNPVFNEYSTFFVGSDSRWLTRFPAPSAATGGEAGSGIRRIGRKVLDYLLYAVTNPFRRDRIAFLRSSIHEVIDLHHPAVYEWWNTGFLQFVRRKIVISNGWIFWDHESFIKHAERIREYFRLVPALAAQVQKHVEHCRQEADVLVGIHIRHGDYRTAGGGAYFYETGHYVALMRRLAAASPARVCFLVCSDEPIQSADFAGLTIYPGPGTAIEDMYALAACDYIIGPPSSFSGWASFFGQVPLYFITDLQKALDGIGWEDFSVLDSFDYRTESSRYQRSRLT